MNKNIPFFLQIRMNNEKNNLTNKKFDIESLVIIDPINILIKKPLVTASKSKYLIFFKNIE